jgi:Uncharacterised nucleotidyltransferase
VISGKRSLLEFLADEAASRSVRFLLIGGHALEAYHFARQTVDLDCLIAAPDLAVVDRMLSGSGFATLAQTESFRRYRHAHFGYLDVLLADSTTFEKLFSAAQALQIGDRVLKVPALPHLIAMKLHAAKNDPSRELREFADIEQLVRRNAVPADELTKLCAQFGPADSWNKLNKHLHEEG